MKQTNFLKSFFLLCALIVGSSSVWAETVTLTSQQIKAGTGSTSYGACTATDGGGNTWNAYAIKNQHSNATSDYHFWQIKKYASSTAYYVQVPTLGSKITQLVITVSGTSNSRDGGGNSATLYFSASNSTSATGTGVASGTGASSVTIDCSSLNLKTGYITASGAVRIWDVQVTYEDTPAYTINAESNNTEWGTVSLSGSTITGAPKSGYRYASPAYTVTPANSATVSQNGNAFTVTPSANTTVTINFEAIPTYTVTFNAEGGSCGTPSATETIGGAGVTLPSATIELDGWTFAGWAAASQASTQNRPILYLAGETYYPTDNVTLYAVYSLDGIDGTKYQRVTELSQATSASNIIIVNNNKAIDDALGSVDAPDEEDGKITPSDNIVWSISGNNTDGFELTTTALETNKKLGISSIPLSAGNVELTVYNTNWIIEEHTGGENLFVLKNTTNPSNVSNVGVLEYTSNRWKYCCVAASTYKTTNNNSKSKLYIPVKTVYNSNPTDAIIQPNVTFEKGNTTLYLDGTTTYTNAASVTKVDKSVTGYKSSNESVATVDASGVVNAVGIGTATITAYLDIELGVHKAAEASYVVTVKNTTTIAGLKTIDNNSGVAFAADLTDAVVTYVSGDYAYIQDASAAILVNKSGHGLIAGKKINGAVSGTVKITNSIDQLTAINLSAATVTDDGVIPAALTKTVAEVRANAASLDGQLVTINAVTIDKSNTTTTLKDGSKIEEVEATITMYSPNSGASVNDKEKGNFTGYISLYNGETPRINLYEQSQFVKTYNAPTAQTLTFDEDDVNLDEDTEALANYVGQAVNGAHTTLTWSIEDGSDDILTSLNASTGALVLNGSIGAAIIKVTAAAEEVEEAGVITPYLAANASYMITVNPRYTVTFSANGQETEARQESYGAAVTIPTIAPVGNYEIQGWLDEEIDTPTDTKPVGLIEESTYTPANDITLYAVYAKQTIGDDEDVELYNNTGSTGTDATSGITASGNINQNNGNSKPSFGLTNSSNKTITLSGIDISTVKVATMNFDYKVGKNGTNYSSLTVTQYDNQDNVLGTPANVTASNTNYNTSDDISLNTSCVKITIVCNPAAGSTYDTYVDNIVINVVRPSIIYYDYRTSLTNATVTMTIGPAGFNTWHQPFAAEFIADGDNGKAYYAADVDANQVVNFQQFSENKIPANTGAIIKGEVNAEVSYTILDADVDFSAENLLHGTNTTETITADDDYYYFISGRTKVSEDPLTYEYGFFVPKSLEIGSTFTNNANKAYLQVLKTMFGGATSKGLGMSWTDAETNGITNVSSTYTDGHYYNLAGQRVSEDYKGVVIYNGKKIIKK